MTTHITVDPFEKNSINNALNPLNNNINNNYNTFNLQNILQMQILNTVLTNLNILNTGNQTIDTIIKTIIQSMIIGMISVFITHIGSSFKYISIGIKRAFQLITHIIIVCHNYTMYKFGKTPVKLIKRDVEIPYISDTRQLNELYKAVFWYLTNNEEINYIKEPFLQYVFDKKISIENKNTLLNNLLINKILSQNKTKKIKYKKYEITYSLTTEKITVYTDKDRIRENYKVLLSTYVYETDNIDILEEFCQLCLTEYIKNMTSNNWVQQIYTNNGIDWKSSPSNNNRKLDTIILKKGLKEEIKNDLQMFLNSEEWYKDRDIPYSRGYLFYGFPGTGKTSMIKAISSYCKRHIHFLMLSNVSSDAELIELFKKINYTDTVLVLEDIDAMIDIVKSRNNDNTDKNDKNDKNKNNNKNNKNNKNNNNNRNDDNDEFQSKLTLSGILNAIDGVFSCHGRILIMTTNHPEVLDEALIRPGRIDGKYLFDNCDKMQIKELYEMFFGQPLNENQLNCIKNQKYSPAHITSVFLRYRNNPIMSLLHFDDIETKIDITPMIKNI
jgi:hypothetical protein